MSWLLALLAAGCAAHGAASHAAASFFVSGGFRGRLLFCFLLFALLLRFVFFVFYLESGIMFIYLRGLKRALDSLLLLPVSHSLC